MKRLSIIIICLLLIVGCGEKKELQEEKSSTSTTTTTSTSEPSQTTTSKSSTKQVNKKTTTSTKATTTAQSTTTIKKLGKNEYIALKDNKVHKYSYVYPNKDACETAVKGENLGDNFPYEEKIYQFLSCEEIKDQNDNHLWGIYFITSYTENTGFYY